MKEAQDFVPTGSKVEADLDMRSIIDGHSTPVMKSADATELRPLVALQRYHTFAQMQLAQAVEHEVAGSMALYALGKAYAAIASEGNNSMPVAEPKAVVCYHAAILACSQNYMAANDLGALLARNGDYANARQLLEHSVLVRRCSSNLANLARIYEIMGDPRSAALAKEKSQYAGQLEAISLKELQGSSNSQVRWVDPDTLALAANGTALATSATHNAANLMPEQGASPSGVRPANDPQNFER
jgi:hypothetical protein